MRRGHGSQVANHYSSHDKDYPTEEVAGWVNKPRWQDSEVAVTFDDLVKSFYGRFPGGGLERCDFRPHFDGYVVTAYSTLLPARDEATTRETAMVLLNQIVTWLRHHSNVFDAGDRLQLIVGFPESVKPSGRQIFKCWLPSSALAELQGLDFASVGGAFRELDAWPMAVVWSAIDPNEDDASA